MGLKRWPLNITLDEGHQDDAGKVSTTAKVKVILAYRVRRAWGDGISRTRFQELRGSGIKHWISILELNCWAPVPICTHKGVKMLHNYDEGKVFTSALTTSCSRPRSSRSTAHEKLRRPRPQSAESLNCPERRCVRVAHRETSLTGRT